jgi:enoyl-CoA hydratase/carnithine racemase
MGYQTILVEKSDSVVTITLNRPEVRNALNLEMREEATRVLDELAGNESIRELVLTGAGGNF